MKKLAAILLLALVLYNAFGYYMLFAYEHQNARLNYLENLSDAAYQTIAYKLPDYTVAQNSEYEYIDKEVVLEDKTYHIIKKRIVDNTLYMYYLPNHRQDELRQNLNNIVESQITTKQSHSDSPVKTLLKSFLKDYIPNDIYVLVESYPCEVRETKNIGDTSDEPFSSPTILLHSPPPEVA